MEHIRYIFTLIGRHLTAEHHQAVDTLFQQHDIQSNNVKQWASQTPYQVSYFEVTSALPIEQLRTLCLSFSNTHHVDLAVQTFVTLPRRLVCFDMDSTLIGQEVIDELAKEAGIGEQVAEITERAMQGELDFDASFRARVALLKGLNTDVLAKIASRLTINEGAERLIKTLKQHGYHTAILSGGFEYFARFLQEKLGIDEVHANSLNVVDGVVTGEVTTTIVDGARKAFLLQQIAKQQNITLEQVVAVGDGANDLPMLVLANLGVAYHAKPLVREQAKQTLSYVGLDGVLDLLNAQA